MRAEWSGGSANSNSAQVGIETDPRGEYSVQEEEQQQQKDSDELHVKHF